MSTKTLTLVLLTAALATSSPFLTPPQKSYTTPTTQATTPNDQTTLLLSPSTSTTGAGAICRTTVPSDPLIKDDWDFCCLQDNGWPVVASAGNYAEDGMATLKCEIRAEYVESLRGCFGEFAGLDAEVGVLLGGVVCEWVEGEGEGEE